MAARQRVAVYVTRWSAAGPELLVFDHRDYPVAGTQVPAGGLAQGEEPEDAALREVTEETGLADIVIHGRLGVQRRPHPETGQPRETTFVHASTGTDVSAWTHQVTAEGGDAGPVLECYFVPVGRAAGLLPDMQDEFLRSIQ